VAMIQTREITIMRMDSSPAPSATKKWAPSTTTHPLETWANWTLPWRSKICMSISARSIIRYSTNKWSKVKLDLISNLLIRTTRFNSKKALISRININIRWKWCGKGLSLMWRGRFLMKLIGRTTPLSTLISLV
jgi:hypothetical protein